MKLIAIILIAQGIIWSTVFTIINASVVWNTLTFKYFSDGWRSKLATIGIWLYFLLLPFGMILYHFS